MGTLSPIHWIIVAIVILLLFGPSALSKAGRGLGRTVRSVQDLKRSVTEGPSRSRGPAHKAREPGEPASSSGHPGPAASDREQRQG